MQPAISMMIKKERSEKRRSMSWVQQPGSVLHKASSVCSMIARRNEAQSFKESGECSRWPTWPVLEAWAGPGLALIHSENLKSICTL